MAKTILTQLPPLNVYPFPLILLETSYEAATYFIQTQTSFTIFVRKKFTTTCSVNCQTSNLVICQ